MADEKESKKSTTSFWQTLPGCITAIAGLITAIAGLIAILYTTHVLPLSPATPTPAIITEMPIGPTSVLPSESSTQVFAATPVVFNPYPDPADYFDALGVPMRLVPAREFIMGSSNSSGDGPAHTVYLNGFYMDKYEVTNQLYKACVEAEACEQPKQSNSATHPSYYGNPDFDNYPVIYVEWTMAQNYCTWRGAQLPTEAQWEKAARGVDGFTYPWG